MRVAKQKASDYYNKKSILKKFANLFLLRAAKTCFLHVFEKLWIIFRNENTCKPQVAFEANAFKRNAFGFEVKHATSVAVQICSHMQIWTFFIDTGAKICNTQTFSTFIKTGNGKHKQNGY